MINNERSEDEVTVLKKEVEYLKEKLNSVSESERSRGIETQKLKIHDIEGRTCTSWLFSESKIGSVISIFLPLLPAMLAFGFARFIVIDILQRQSEVFQALMALEFNFAPMLNLVPFIVFIGVYVVGFKITSLIAGTIVKHKILKRERNKLRMLESPVK
jgi:hypothetical protein